jgi:hypothetical protein
MSTSLAIAFIIAACALFAWLVVIHPLIAAAWFALSCVMLAFFMAACRTIREGEAE